MSHYLALEGIEGAGKSTVAAEVIDALQRQSLEVVHVREPGGTATGEAIRKVLLDPDGDVAPWAEALLFAAARSQLAEEIIRPALARGAWVVSDRSVYSSLAYQGHGRTLGVEAVRRANEVGLGGTWPEMVVLLEIGPEAGLARQSNPDRIGAEGIAFQQRVAEGFAELAEAESDRFLIVDAGADLRTVTSQILDEIERRW